MIEVIAVAAIFISFTISACAGLGGSLLLVPALSLLLGPKEGVALSALLLGCNNIVKVTFYRATLPYRASAALVAMTLVGALLGAMLLAVASELVVGIAVLVSFVFAGVLEGRKMKRVQKAYAPTMALAAGATSGFSGTSGPLKGMAIRSLDLDRVHFVGAASMVSMVGDLTKTAVFTDAQLLGRSAVITAAGAIPLMLFGTWLGRRLNRTIGEGAFTGLFWTVIAGYTARIIFAIT